MLHTDKTMEELEWIMGEEEVLEDMPTLENASFFVELGEKCNTDTHSEMLDTIRILKVDMESLKANNLKLMNAKSDQEDINELILKSLTDPQNNNGQNYCSTGKKRKGILQGDISEETKDNIPLIAHNLKT